MKMTRLSETKAQLRGRKEMAVYHQAIRERERWSLEIMPSYNIVMADAIPDDDLKVSALRLSGSFHRAHISPFQHELFKGFHRERLTEQIALQNGGEDTRGWKVLQVLWEHEHLKSVE